MSDKSLPFSKQFIEEVIQTFETPFYLYDEGAIRRNARDLLNSFAGFAGFQEYFAVKAAPNPHLMQILNLEGLGADCSSLAELTLCQRLGITGNKVMFTSNNTPAKEYIKAREINAIINLDDITHIDFLERHGGLPDLISFRYNPGKLRSGNAIIGHPEEAKFGVTRDQLFDGYTEAKRRGVRRFGLHTMVASNELNPDFFVETGEMLFSLAVEILKGLDIRLEFVNLGGGLGIPYRPDQQSIDIKRIASGLRALYERMIVPAGIHPLAIYMENGRYVTGPYGYLVTRAIHQKNTYKRYIGVDACMANLMRPGMYGAYHHITVLGKEAAPANEVVDVIGSLCENNDKFAINRPLPHIEIGDLLVIQDVGAHGHAMGFQYNGKLRSAELLLRGDGSIKLIRRAETLDDYFATLDFGACAGP